MKNVSYFKRITDTTPMNEVTWDDVYQLIRNDDVVKSATEQLREAMLVRRWDLNNPDDKKSYQHTKVQLLSGFMPGGIFITRKVDDCEHYSQVVHVDFDGLSIQENQQLKDFIATDNSVCLSFLSPGGRGRKIFHTVTSKAPITEVNVDVLVEFHRQAFDEIKERYQKAGLLFSGFDDSVSNLNRACYISNDVDCFYNPDAVPLAINFDENKSKAERERESEDDSLYRWYAAGVDKYMSSIGDEAQAKVELLIAWLKQNNLSITNSYSQWIRVLFALKRSFTDDIAEDLGRKFSQLDASFNEAEFQKKFHQRIKPERSPTLATIFYYGKLLGYQVKDPGIKRTVFLEEFIRGLTKDGWKIRYNKFSGYLENFSNSRWARLVDMDIDKIKVGIFGHRYQRNIVEETINVIAPTYNPIEQLINSLPAWDGADHIGALTATLNCGDSKWPLILVKRWLMGMIAGLTVHGQYNENVLILQGDQGDGKTRWVRRLFTEAFESCGLEAERYFKQKQLDPENKDDMVLLCTSFVVFFDELNSIVNRKADIEAFKNMTSATTHTIRKPYARHSEDLKRFASIIGTVNESQFLADSTGNRRFWTLAVGKIDQDHTVNIPQVFAQALALVRKGERHYLNAAEVKELNETYLVDFEIVKPEEELIRLCVEPSDTRMLTATQVLGAINALSEREVIKCGAANFGKMLKKYFPDRYVHLKQGRFYRVHVRSPKAETFLASRYEELSGNKTKKTTQDIFGAEVSDEMKEAEFNLFGMTTEESMTGSILSTRPGKRR